MSPRAEPDRDGTDAALLDALRGHVQHLAGTIGERNVFIPNTLPAAADYIEATWAAQGYAVTRQWFEARGERVANLEAARTGRTRPGEILLIGAHYDSVVGCPGANDNGTGVAALLEIARLFAAVEPAITVRFVAFVNEEPPFFMTREQGSVVYADAARARGDDIRLMVALETIGYFSDRPGSQQYPPLFGLFYPHQGNFLGFVSDLRSRAVMRRAVEVFRAHSDVPLEHCATFRFVPGVDWSDHRSFWKAGYRAFMVTDTAPYRYPHYHLPSDTPDRVCYPAFARVTEGLFLTFRTLAQQGL
ncbi:MAG: M28 family peptidase [Gammaproteobacteria bacterium]|nr:M28 family peptidase [Gammaproteobacteria bacterium]